MASGTTISRLAKWQSIERVRKTTCLGAGPPPATHRTLFPVEETTDGIYGTICNFPRETGSKILDFHWLKLVRPRRPLHTVKKPKKTLHMITLVARSLPSRSTTVFPQGPCLSSATPQRTWLSSVQVAEPSRGTPSHVHRHQMSFINVNIFVIHISWSERDLGQDL